MLYRHLVLVGTSLIPSLDSIFESRVRTFLYPAALKLILVKGQKKHSALLLVPMSRYPESNICASRIAFYITDPTTSNRQVKEHQVQYVLRVCVFNTAVARG
jgi:hypothetical protein